MAWQYKILSALRLCCWISIFCGACAYSFLVASKLVLNLSFSWATTYSEVKKIVYENCFRPSQSLWYIITRIRYKQITCFTAAEGLNRFSSSSSLANLKADDKRWRTRMYNTSCSDLPMDDRFPDLQHESSCLQMQHMS